MEPVTLRAPNGAEAGRPEGAGAKRAGTQQTLTATHGTGVSIAHDPSASVAILQKSETFHHCLSCPL